MKKFFISALFVLGFASYVAYNNSASSATAAQATLPITDTQSPVGTTAYTPTTDTAGASAPPPSQTPTSAPVETTKPSTSSSGSTAPKTPKGQYVDGTYTGPAEDAYYGNVQVQVAITGGKLSNVTFLQYPNDRSTSRYINQQAMPMLRAEAIQAQSARIDGVSGASDTSAAFQQSLAAALAKAAA